MSAPVSSKGFRADSHAMTAALIAITLAARIALVSLPYYVDGPNHVKAIENGSLFIQPPGYFLFALAARAIALLLHVSAAHAVSGMNVAFSVAGVWLFRKITLELFPGLLGLLLACCYAASNVVWFAAEIHSTYASMTFFGPLLFYALLMRARVEWCWVIWAVLTGFRPSDGVFLLPVMLYAGVRWPWRRSLVGLALAAAICAAWYVPTVLHFGGSAIAPFSAAGRQLGQLPSGILVHGLTSKGSNNVLHFLFGSFNAWNVLTPFVVLGAFQKGRIERLSTIWIAPACLFFALYFVSDSLYLAILVAPGLVLAGFGLRRFLNERATAAVATASIAIACIHMLLLRPVPAHNIPTGVLDSYSLEYTRWALQNRYAKRLSVAIEELKR